MDAEQDGDREPDRQRSRERDEPEQKSVVGPLERRARMAKGARGGRQLSRAAVRSDRRGLEQRGAFERERARPNRLARTPDGGLRLAGQVGLVQGQTVSTDQRSVGDDLITGRNAHQVTHHHPIDGDATVDAVSYHHRLGRDQRGKPVECALGANLLKRPDRDVRDQDSNEQSVLPGSKHERQHAEEKQDRVRDIEGVGPDDAGVRAARAFARELAALLESARGLGLGQTGEWGFGGAGDSLTLTGRKAAWGKPGFPREPPRH